ncbi:hypothetical protein MAPG_08009 [Magnaporthiopsis poae ATCC 64411]|uniref:PH domain-containing protein n=1 Tax=Magnaporthiopsis poae (strain ATCC 64411 / 73-15) TaxID=644358 RepID=A0A0C4E678_MAGP6|nr:hypothetical protein MAPG_08009 [Magnaporthiopsis poae ATCC 64411]
MAGIATAPPGAINVATESSSRRHGALAAPPTAAAAASQRSTSPARLPQTMQAVSPVNQNGCFEFDRVLKCGYVQKRTKTKAWKTVYLVMRPNTIYIYKSDKEDKLRGQIYLSELTAVTLLKDPKQKRQNVFGLFSPSKNYYFQAASAKDSHGWVDIIRRDARIEEEEEEIFLASPIVRRGSCGAGSCLAQPTKSSGVAMAMERERALSSSPEPHDNSIDAAFAAAGSHVRRPASAVVESFSQLGSGFVSHSDLSDFEPPGRSFGASAESLRVQTPAAPELRRPSMAARSGGGPGGLCLEQDPDRVIWQGSLWFLRTKGGLKQWKRSWAVLRPRNLILYRDSSEYSPHLVVPLSSILNVVDLDPISRTKRHCLQVITEEKRFRFCALDEESLLQCLGAFKSLLARRRELEARVAATVPVEGAPPTACPMAHSPPRMVLTTTMATTVTAN